MKFGNIIKRQKREENREEPNQEMWVRFYIEYKIGVSIIDSIPDCNTENNLKRGKNQEMWLHYYIENKLEYLSPIVFNIVVLKMLWKKTRTKKCGFVSI